MELYELNAITINKIIKNNKTCYKPDFDSLRDFQIKQFYA